MRKTRMMMVVCSTFLLGSCASIVSKSVYSVRFDSSPQKATVNITNRAGHEIFNGTTPCQVRLKSGAGFFKKAMYSITYSKPGYLTKEVELIADLNGWYFGNVIFGGLLGLLIVDPATGAMYKLNTVSFNETLAADSGTTKATQDKELRIYDINEIPDNWKKNLVKIDLPK